MMSWNKIWQKLLIIVLIISALFPTEVLANSAPTTYYGESASEAIILKGPCPIEVEHELLTFDLQQFPEDYIESKDFFDYSGSVTAEYSFYNPTDETITATLVFPFGNMPTYAPYELMGKYFASTDANRITVDGKEVEKRLRHTYAEYWDFDINEEKEKLLNEYMTHSFYHPDLPVTRYVYKVEAHEILPKNTEVSMKVKLDSAETKLITDGWVREAHEITGNYVIDMTVDSMLTEVYVVGDQEFHPEWIFNE